MKKWILAFVVMAFIAGETSCVVRVRERRRPVPASRPRAVVVY